MSLQPNEQPKMHPVTAIISLVGGIIIIYFAIQLFIA